MFQLLLSRAYSTFKRIQIVRILTARGTVREQNTYVIQQMLMNRCTVILFLVTWRGYSFIRGTQLETVFLDVDVFVCVLVASRLQLELYRV